MKKLIIILSLVLLTGCSFDKPEPTIQDVNEFVNNEVQQIEIAEDSQDNIKKEDFSDWVQVETGLKVIKIPILDTEKIIDTATIFEINPHQFTFTLHQDIDNPKTIHDWAEEVNTANLLINGSYFNSSNEPTGGYIINNKQFGTLTLEGENGYTGALQINNEIPVISYLPQTNLDKNNLPENLIQTFPTIVLPGGKPGIKTNTHKKARRTIIAENKNGSILIILTERPSMSLYEVMEFLQGSDLEIDIAINLDGGPSTGFVLNSDEYNLDQASFAIPNIISIIKK